MYVGLCNYVYRHFPFVLPWTPQTLQLMFCSCSSGTATSHVCPMMLLPIASAFTASHLNETGEGTKKTRCRTAGCKTHDTQKLHTKNMQPWLVLWSPSSRQVLSESTIENMATLTSIAHAQSAMCCPLLERKR